MNVLTGRTQRQSRDKVNLSCQKASDILYLNQQLVPLEMINMNRNDLHEHIREILHLC